MSATPHCVKCKTPYPKGIPKTGQCFNCASREFRSGLPVERRRSSQLMPVAHEAPVGRDDGVARGKVAKGGKRGKRGGDPRARMPAPAERPRPRSPIPESQDQDGLSYKPVPRPPSSRLEVFTPRVLPPPSDRAPKPTDTVDVPARRPDDGDAAPFPAPNASPEEDSWNSVVEDAAAEARAFAEAVGVNAGQTSTSLRKITASPLVWSPGSSTESELIAGRYLIQNPRDDLLGTGAKGVVYKAYDTRMGGRKVALKLFFDAFGDLNDPEVVEEEKNRTKREIEIQAELTHPSIVTIHDQFESEHGSGVVLEFVDGETLEERIERFKVIPVGDAVRLTIELTKAVEFMHRARFLHRDIKPGNVLITRDENVKLIDFGLSKNRHERQKKADSDNPTRSLKLSDDVYRTQEGDIVGTPAYMAPEQAAGRLSEVDERSDIYGLGALLYHCLTNRPPVDKDTIEEVLELVVQGIIPPLRSLNAKVDPALQAIVMKSLARDPDDRFRSAYALREQLQKFQDGVPLDRRIYREPLLKRGLRWVEARRKLITTLLLTVLILGSASVAGWVYWKNRQQSEVKAWSEEARRKTNAGLYQQALKLCEQVLESDSDNRATRKLQTDLNFFLPYILRLDEALKIIKRADFDFDNGDRDVAESNYITALRSLKELKEDTAKIPLDGTQKIFQEELSSANLERWIDKATGLVPFDLATPKSTVGDPLNGEARVRRLNARLERTEETIVIKNGRVERTPITGAELPIGAYQLELFYTYRSRKKKTRILLPLRVSRREKILIGPLPMAPQGMVYVPGMRNFRPGNERHDKLEVKSVIAPFFIQKLEVSNLDYMKFIRAKRGQVSEAVLDRWRPSDWLNRAVKTFPRGAGSLPVTNITLEAARAYADWLTTTQDSDLNLKFRLPTEAEWQLAASGGDPKLEYPYGQYYRPEWTNCGSGRPRAVGSFPKDESPYGVLDMGGNVSEWVEIPLDLTSKVFMAKGGFYNRSAPNWQRELRSLKSSQTIGFRLVAGAPKIERWKPK